MKKKAEVNSVRRRRKHPRLVSILAMVLVIGIAGAVTSLIAGQAKAAKRTAPVEANERTFYYLKGDDWQPFEQSYSLGFINLGSSEQTRHCSDAAYYNKNPAKPEKTICKFKGVESKNLNYYIDYPAGAWYMGEPYDIREYIWSVKGSCVPEVAISKVRQWYAGSIARDCDGITIREIHFYPLGTLGKNADGSFKKPSQAELLAAENSVHAGNDPGSGFRGVMRLDDFDGGGEGYGVPIGYGGIWTTINTQTKIRTANGLGSITSATSYKWVGDGGNTAAGNDRTAIWLQFVSTSDRPLTLAYYTTGHRSSISSQLYTIRYKISGSIPATLRKKMTELENLINRRAQNLLEFATDECDIEEDGTSVCDDDGDSSGAIVIPDGNNDHYNNTIADTSLVYEQNTIKQIDITQHGLYDPYTYYEELMSELPPGYTFEGWSDADTGSLIPRYGELQIVNSNKTYTGVISIETPRNPGESTCYSDLEP